MAALFTKSVLSIFLFMNFSLLIYTQNVTYHTFMKDGKTGIVDSEGNITLAPTYHYQDYYVSGFNNRNRSEFLLVYNNNSHSNIIIDYKGKEYFKEIKKLKELNYYDNGAFCFYYDDSNSKSNIHILSLKDEKEIAFLEGPSSIEFHGSSEYFFSTVNQGQWKIFNSSGNLIFKYGRTLDIDVLEEKGVFVALAVSHFSQDVAEYIDVNGKPIVSNNFLISKFQESRSKRLKGEGGFYDYPIKCNEQFEKNYKFGYDLVECHKYSSGLIRYIFTKNGLQGVLDEKGNIIIEAIYPKVMITYHFFKIVNSYNKVGLCNINGEIIYPAIFNAISYEPSIENNISLTFESYSFSASQQGEIYCPKDVLLERK